MLSVRVRPKKQRTGEKEIYLKDAYSFANAGIVPEMLGNSPLLFSPQLGLHGLPTSLRPRGRFRVIG